MNINIEVLYTVFFQIAHHQLLEWCYHKYFDAIITVIIIVYA